MFNFQFMDLRHETLSDFTAYMNTKKKPLLIVKLTIVFAVYSTIVTNIVLI